MNRYGAFQASDPLPSMPNGQRNVLRPAGQADLSSYRCLAIGRPLQPTSYVSWLARNGISCNQWSSMTLPNKISYVNNFINSNVYDPFKRTLSDYVSCFHINHVISAIDADCLRAAVSATNAPRPSAPISRPAASTHAYAQASRPQTYGMQGAPMQGLSSEIIEWRPR